ncbi:MAG: thiamine biosynthesis protein ThiS, partial [Moorea sp. SIO3G5]|nr:thiamine biosynthesis protein ThiS [Moorena sp. SIO3G5]
MISNNTTQITLEVNGESRTCSCDTKLPQLLEQLGLNPR